MESGTALHLKNFSDWLAWVEQFPFVPGWHWTPKSWGVFNLQLTKIGIIHCRDSYGNVLLGAQTPHEWFTKLKGGDIRLVLQAHLDHPGAVATYLLDGDAINGYQRYNAMVQGGLRSHLKGKRFFLFDHNGDFVEEVLIDAQTQGFKASCVSFRTKKEFHLPGYLRGRRRAWLWQWLR